MAGHDEIQALFPAYLAGTLGPADTASVAAHVRECEACGRDLEALRHVQSALRLAVERRPAPAPDLFARVAARVEAAERRDATIARERAGSVWSRAAAWAASLMTPRFAPALALGLIVLQFAALAVLGGRMWIAREAGYGTASGPEATAPAGPERRLRVAFQETASEARVRAALRGVGARIVDGPTAAGFYVVSVPAGDEGERALAALRGRADVIRFVEPLPAR